MCLNEPTGTNVQVGRRKGSSKGCQKGMILWMPFFFLLVDSCVLSAGCAGLAVESVGAVLESVEVPVAVEEESEVLVAG